MKDLQGVLGGELTAIAAVDRQRIADNELRKQRVMRRNGRKGTRTWGYATTSGKRNNR